MVYNKLTDDSGCYMTLQTCLVVKAFGYEVKCCDVKVSLSTVGLSTLSSLFHLYKLFSHNISATDSWRD